MSDTPRTDEVTRTYGDASVEWEEELVAVDACKAIERELNAATSEIERLRKANFQLREGAEEQQQRMNYLRKGIFEQNQEIEQTCGKVLGYPWFKDDQKSFPGSTEKDGVCVGDHVAETIVSELASRYTEALARIKRLEEAGDMMALHAQLGGIPLDHIGWVNAWREAKEAKP